MSDRILIYVAFAFALILLFGVNYYIVQSNLCIKKGGVLVTAPIGYVCVAKP